MKPRILSLLSDERMGGVKTSLSSLMSSRLNEKFEFAIAPLKRAIASLRIFQTNNQPDIIIVHDACSWKILPRLFFLKILLKTFKKKSKLVIEDHHYSAAFERLKVPSPSRFRLMLKFCYWCADRILVVSKAQGAWMLKHQLVKPNKLAIIQQSLNCDRFLAFPLKPIEKPLIFAAYGRFDEQKGFDILLEAIKLLPDLNFHLKIAGYGSDEGLLKKLAADHPQVEFVGKIDDVPTFLNNCDVVIIPSRWEPWGNVCLEAKASGKPIIASAVDGLVEQIEGLGLLIPPDDPRALAKAIAQICEMATEELSDRGMRGRESVRNAWNRHLTEWEDLLCQLLGT